jgi:hypothetical protein
LREVSERAANGYVPEVKAAVRKRGNQTMSFRAMRSALAATLLCALAMTGAAAESDPSGWPTRPGATGSWP